MRSHMDFIWDAVGAKQLVYPRIIDALARYTDGSNTQSAGGQ